MPWNIFNDRRMSDPREQRMATGGARGPEQIKNDPRQWPEWRRGPVQQQLKLGGAMRRARPEQQTPDQFARDPRTWWHGTYNPKGLPEDVHGRSGEGFHAGTRQAALDILTTGNNPGRKEFAEGGSVWGINDRIESRVPGRMFPLRHVGNMDEPVPNVHRDNQYHSDLGPGTYRAENDVGKYYANDVEDEGSVSLGVPRRKSHLASYSEMVKGAQSAGRYVHPNIAWAAEHVTDHTGEDIMHPLDVKLDKKLKSSGQGKLF